MIETFDTYSKHSRAYKLTEISALILLLLFIPIIVLHKWLDQLPRFWNLILLCIFFLSILSFIAGVFIRTVSSNIVMYIKDGELNLDMDKFEVDSKTFSLKNLIKIEFKIIGYRGQVVSKSFKDGTGNKIKVYEKSGEVLEKAFAINTKDGFNSLKSILMQWQQTGLEVDVDGFDLE